MGLSLRSSWETFLSFSCTSPLTDYLRRLRTWTFHWSFIIYHSNIHNSFSSDLSSRRRRAERTASLESAPRATFSGFRVEFMNFYERKVSLRLRLYNSLSPSLCSAYRPVGNLKEIRKPTVDLSIPFHLLRDWFMELESWRRINPNRSGPHLDFCWKVGFLLLLPRTISQS